MSKCILYVGSLSDTTSDYQLRDLFGTYGFVEMCSGEQAMSAVVALEGVLFEGNCLRLYITPYASSHS